MFAKRLFDLALLVLSLPLMLPLFLLVALMVRLKLGGADIFSPNATGAGWRAF